MSNLTTKQKVIVGIIIGIMLIVIGIYGYTALHKDEGEFDISDLSSNEEVNSTNSESGATKEIANSVTNVEENVNGYENLDGKIVVHITGEVHKTGVLILPEGARIADAIDSAGGNTDEADLDEVNLAYILQDGQKIYIPNKEDKEKAENKEYITSESGNNVIVESENTAKGVSKKVNINTATQEELETLPGIGEAIATRIIEYRKQNGKFSKIEDLQNVKGIGDSKFNDIKEYVVVN